MTDTLINFIYTGDDKPYSSTATYKLLHMWLFLPGTSHHWIVLLFFGKLLNLGDVGGISVLLENTCSLNSSIHAQTTPSDRQVAQSCSRWGFLELEKGSGEGQGWPGPWAAEQRVWMTTPRPRLEWGPDEMKEQARAEREKVGRRLRH